MKLKGKLKNLWRNEPSNLGNLHEDKTGLLKHREWRGVSDTAYDYFRWLITWKDIIVMTGKAPVSTAKGLLNYRWMMSYLTAPAWVDRHTEGLRGPQLRITHLHMNMLVKPTTDLINFLLSNDRHFHKKSKWADKTVNVDEIFSSEFIAGFPNLRDNHVTTIPIFLTSMVDQNITPPYLDITESYGVPADVCPLPSAEAGVAINDDYPLVGVCSLTCNMPCDGSIMNSSYLDRRFNIPTQVINVPLRYNGEDVQEYAVDEIKSAIAFVEEQTGEKWDWNAFFKAMKNYNKQTEYEIQKWEVNKTDFPQMTGATFWLYRLFYFHISGGMDPRFLKVDKKVNRLMLDAYNKKVKCSKEMRHRAIVWSCPANYYTSLANWLENCWGVNVVMDMETMISYYMYDTQDKEKALGTLAKTLQRTTMRKHTKGGYANVVDELWRIVEEFNADMVIMYDQISCKGMDGLNGIFDDQAREHNVSFIWVPQDLMDPRTISRRDMREQINKYMTTVLREEPVDPTLVDFDDTLAW